jgi:hypothetical protein
VAVKYLLTCTCGEKIPVTAPQAGQTVRCSCGVEQEVPTLMELKRLETIEDVPAKPSLLDTPDGSNWGPAQGLITVGVIMIVLAICWLIYVVAFTKPVPPNEMTSEELKQRKIEDMSLHESILIWNQLLRHDIRLRIKTEQDYLKEMKDYRIRFWIADILLAIALCFTILTVIFVKRAQAKRAEALAQHHNTGPPNHY